MNKNLNFADPLQVVEISSDPLEDETFEFAKTSHGKTMLIDRFNIPYYKDGHPYYSLKHKLNKIYWRCYYRDRGETRCPSRIITMGDKIVARKRQHNHPYILDATTEKLSEKAEIVYE